MFNLYQNMTSAQSSTAATSVIRDFENVQIATTNNTIFDYNYSSNNSTTNNFSNSIYEATTASLLTDFVANTTTNAVDYASQWLASTIGISNVANSEYIDATSDINDTFTAFGYNYTSSRTSTVSLSPSPSSSSAASLQPSNKINNTLADLDKGILINNNYVDILIDYHNNDENDEDEYHDCHPDNPQFNCSRMDFLEYLLGPQTLPLYKVLLITIFYGGIFITGVLGNVLVCVVIVKHSAMHTATNYYLFSLAVSDLIYLIFGLPTEVFLYWHQYPYLFGLPFCKLRAFISEASTYVSVFTIVAFSVERYLAICHPLHLYAMSGFKRALRIIALLWILSFLGAIPFGIMTQISYWYYPVDQTLIKESAFCGMPPLIEMPVFEISFLVFFFIPMILIIYFYGRMGAKIRSTTTQQLGVQQGSMQRESRHQQSRKAVIRMLAAVVITFFVCWLPFHVQRLWYVYGKDYSAFQEVNEWLFSTTGFIYYISCTVNPILYNVMSHRYRVAFKDILCGRRKSVYYNSGFARDQSSFRETTVATSFNNSTYDRSHSVKGRSFKIVHNGMNRHSVKSNNVSWKKTDFNLKAENDLMENLSKNLVVDIEGGTGAGTIGASSVVVCVDNVGINGRTKVFTENEANESLLNKKNNETCI